MRFFKERMAPGTSLTTHLNHMRNLAKEADIAGISKPDLMVMIILNSIAHCEKSTFNKIKSMDKVTMEVLQERFYAIDDARKSHEAAEDESALNRIYAKGQAGKFDKGRKRSASSSSTSAGPAKKLLTRADLVGKCDVCASPKHRRAACPHKDKAKCTKCESTKHMANACTTEGDKLAAQNKTTSAKQISSSHWSTVNQWAESSDEESWANMATEDQPFSDRPNIPTPKVPVTFATQDGRKFACLTTPNTGVSRTFIAKDILDKAGIDYRQKKVPCRAANGTPIFSEGVVTLEASIGDRRCLISAVVSSDLKEEALISWHEMKQLGLLPPNWPNMCSQVVENGPQNNLETRSHGNWIAEFKENWAHVSGIPPTIVKGQPIKSINGPKKEKLTDEEAALVNDRIAQLEREEELNERWEQIKKKFTDVLRDELPTTPMDVTPMRIILKDGAIPRKIMRARNIPLHWEKEARKIIEDLVKKKVIRKVEGTTEWISPAHFVPKDNANGLRFVTDFTNLN